MRNMAPSCEYKLVSYVFWFLTVIFPRMENICHLRLNVLLLIPGVTSKAYDKQSADDGSEFGDCSMNPDTKAVIETNVGYTGGMEPRFDGVQTGRVLQVA
jgi:hypothetical protein